MSESVPKNSHSIIYQVHCGRWENASVIDSPGLVFQRMLTYNWKRLKENLGITHIYLLGIWENNGDIIVNEERGTDLRIHPYRYPSPFAITNHNFINPDLGTVTDVERLISCFKALNIKTIVDFVPNHTGIKHNWIEEHPEYYKKDEYKELKTGFSGDVVELDYENENLRKEMITILDHIAHFGFDGVRCDMAHLVPVSFWKDAVTKTHTINSQFIFLAEAYSNSVFDLSIQKNLINAGFDAIYDEPLYRNLKTMKDGNSLTNVLTHYEYVLNNNSSHWIHYTSNHDDDFPFSDDQIFVWICLVSLLPGWLFIYNGLPWGRITRLAHHWSEILPKNQFDLDLIGPLYKEWFTWLLDEQPIIESIQKNDVIIIEWHGKQNKGKIFINISHIDTPITLSDNEKIVIGTEHSLDAYDVNVTRYI